MTEKNIIITGGLGYIGSVLVNGSPNNWKITILDNCSMGNNNIQLGKKVNFISGDIRNYDLIEELIKKSDVIVHLAGIVGEASFQKNPSIATEINQNATKKIVHFTKKYKKKLIFMSTCSIYGFNSKLCTEETVPNPVDDYSRSKIESEFDIKQELDNFVIFRLGTVYGWSPRMRFDIIINKIIEKKLWGEPIEIFGGEQWRPFIHVEDAANALILAVEKSVRNEVFNLVAENHKLLEVAENITNNLKIISEKTDNRSYYADNQKIKKLLGWQPKMNIEKTIEKFSKVDYNDKKFHNHEWDYS